MIMNAAVREILACKPGDEIVVTTQQDYFNESNPPFKEVCDVIRENNRLVLLTR